VSALAGALESYGLQTLSGRAWSAVALVAHSAWLVFPVLAALAFWPSRRGVIWVAVAAAASAAFLDWHPLFWISIGIGVLLLAWCLSRVPKAGDADTRFLALWVLIFFAGASVIFFAGAARYLLPVAAPVALLATRALTGRPLWLAAGAALQLLFSLGLSLVNYQYCDGYRQFAASLRGETESKRVWINGEWGLRYYFESDGGLPLAQGQSVRPGEMVVSSELALPLKFATGGGALVPVAEREVRVALPLRLYGLGVKSAYSSVSQGFRPFDVISGPVDRLHAALVVEHKPELSYLPMNAPGAERQIVSGLHGVEQGGWRWMSGRASLLVKKPEQPSVVEISLYIPEQSPARQVSVSLDGASVIEKTFASPGTYTLRSGPVTIGSETPSIAISVDRTFSVAGDHRELGVILTGVGFKPLK
jgi:hypothetical protein